MGKLLLSMILQLYSCYSLERSFWVYTIPFGKLWTELLISGSCLETSSCCAYAHIMLFMYIFFSVIIYSSAASRLEHIQHGYRCSLYDQFSSAESIEPSSDAI